MNLEPFNFSGGIPMTRADLVKKMAEEAGITKKAAASALTSLVGAIHDSLKKKEGKIRIADLGTFKVIKKKDGTLLKLRHTGFKDPEHFAECSSRWGYYLTNMKSVLDHGTDLRSKYDW